MLNDNAITTVASYWSLLHGCVQGHVAIKGLFHSFKWGEEGLNDTFFEVSSRRTSWGQSTGSRNLRLLDLNSHFIDM